MRCYAGEQNKEVLVEKAKIDKMKCNVCGKEIKVENGIIEEGVLSADKVWGYFSEKDGQIHSFDICEDCYDKWIKTFKIPVEIEQAKELI